MTNLPPQPCPGCQSLLPPIDGFSHRYIGASPACWALYANLLHAQTPPLAPHPLNNLLVDAYATQHPGTPSPQSIQSVAVHLLTLYGVLQQNIAPHNALWLRKKAIKDKNRSRQTFSWLAPPDFTNTISIATITQAPSPHARTQLVSQYVHQILDLWLHHHHHTITTWYQQFIQN
ncbi:MAG TPA: DUF5946 family protein [Anaerolineae bacterium]|nr:DUF5946 family protein [Anaerolineae bacterium]